jgi:hypothetical protein
MLHELHFEFRSALLAMRPDVRLSRRSPARCRFHSPQTITAKLLGSIKVTTQLQADDGDVSDRIPIQILCREMPRDAGRAQSRRRMSDGSASTLFSCTAAGRFTDIVQGVD